MDRYDKILVLTTVLKFNPGELNRMSTPLVDATYDAAKPALKDKAAEIRALNERKENRKRRAQEAAARAFHARKAEEAWNARWKPPAPIVRKAAPVQKNAETIASMIRKGRARVEVFAMKYRATGNQEFARQANEARNFVCGLEKELQAA